jgi:topoisomerase-4 subunit A
MTEMTNTGSELTLHRYTEDAYLEYAIATVKGRALAQVQDGLKPVQRRILYTMRQLGLVPTAKPVKSARVVGDVLGKYHPHGDQAAYDAMVRMAQDFTLRYPLILGQGNYGSRDGDPAAAMRYTEARLSPFADLLLSELGQGTVDFAPNYDGSLEEPTLLPARLPMLLLNGTTGIAVGLAADVPPHNLREVAKSCALVVKNPDTTLDQVLEVLGGPDLPGGGSLISMPEEIRAAYETGRGTFRLRARWVKEDLARGQWQIVVTELPWQVSTRQILEELDALTNPQPPAGKKTITQQQANLKQVALDLLEKATDESDKDSAVRLVLVPRTSKVNPEQLMAFLLANTSLETNISLNMTVVGLDGRPATKGLMAVLQEWAQFRLATVRRRLTYELEQAQRRVHLLEGRLLVFLNLDAVIACIREAEDPKAELMSKFSLSETQAEDILEMRLRQLNKLEGIKIEAELNTLRKEIDRLSKLLSSETAMRSLVAEEIEADAKKYGDDRRTVVAPEPRQRTTVKMAPAVVDEDVTVVVSKNLWVKAYKGKGLSPEQFSFKAGDAMLFVTETRTTSQLCLLDERGRAYSFSASAVPSGRGDGVPLSTLIELQEGAFPVGILSGDPDSVYLFAGDTGYGLTAPLKSLQSRQKAGKSFLTLDPGEKALPPIAVKDMRMLISGATNGRLLAFDIAEVKHLPAGGRGVMLMVLEEGQRLSGMSVCSQLPPSVRVQTPKGPKNLKLQPEDWAKYTAKRARKGALLPDGAVFIGIA